LCRLPESVLVASSAGRYRFPEEHPALAWLRDISDDASWPPFPPPGQETHGCLLCRTFATRGTNKTRSRFFARDRSPHRAAGGRST
jgi:hypothetical protein